MPQIRPFAAVRYARTVDVSPVIAPPYDVLDERGKAELRARHADNIVNVDLPHLPANEAGPDRVYQDAAATLADWLRTGVMARDPRPGLYPYMQTFDHAGRTYHRRGLFALVRLSPFGAGHVHPHEKTHAGPIEDRLKLMHTTGVQLSPIFGLFNDGKNEVTNLLFGHLGKPEQSGTLGGVRNDLWTLPSAEIENQVLDLLGGKPIYIADGHHRYTTALQYQKQISEQAGQPLPPNHPANWCMFALVGMQDSGLLILPTHRLIGGLSGFDPTALQRAIADDFEMAEAPYGPAQIPQFTETYLRRQPHTFGLFDGKLRKNYLLRLKNPAILQKLEPSHSDAWRRLDVAILQRYLIDEVLRPKFAGGQPPTIAYNAEPERIATQVDGDTYQLALLLQPTPLPALEELAHHGEVMPQKSTYFYPKLATGMVINPLR